MKRHSTQHRNCVYSPPGATMVGQPSTAVPPGVCMPASDDARYTVISADTHAGGSHAAYREFLEAKYLDDFDAWRGKNKNPFSDLGDNRRLRNWDDERRDSQQDEDGVVGEVIFPNTVPPFFPNFVLFAK